MATFAFIALAFNTSASTSAVGGILALRLLPAMVGANVAARTATKWDRRHTMLTVDILRAGVVGVVPLVSELWWIYLWVVVLEASGIIFLSARDAAVPQLVTKPQLSLANSLMLGSSYGTIPIGAGVFALLSAGSMGWLEPMGWLGFLGWFGEHALVFWLDSLTFLVSAAFLAKMSKMSMKAKENAATFPADASQPDAPPTGAPSADASPTRLKDAWQIPLVRSVMPATTAVALGLGALFSLGISLIRTDLQASDAQYAVLIILFGLGAVAGLGVARHVANEALRSTRIGVFSMGVVIATMSLSPWLWLTFLGAAGFGIGATLALVSGITALQHHVSDSALVVAFAAFHVVVRSALALAAVATGAIADGVGEALIGGTRIVLLGSGLLVVVSSWAVKLKTSNNPR